MDTLKDKLITEIDISKEGEYGKYINYNCFSEIAVKEAVIKLKEEFSDVIYVQDKIKEIFGDFK